MSIVVCTKCGGKLGRDGRSPDDVIEYRGWCKKCEADIATGFEAFMSRQGINIVGANTEQQQFLLSRDEFIDTYCRERGWNKAELTWDQIHEIRQQDGWKNPLG